MWKDKVQIECQMEEELLRVEANTDEGILNVFIAFTSPSMQQSEKSDGNLSESSYSTHRIYEFLELRSTTDVSDVLLLSKTRCLSALYEMHSARWFQVKLTEFQ